MSDLSFQRRVAYAIGGLGTIAASASTCFAADAGAGVLFGATLVGKALDLGSGKVIDKAFEGFGSTDDYRTVLLNHDLQRVLGASVANVLYGVAADLPWAQKRALRAAAEEAKTRVEAAWKRAEAAAKQSGNDPAEAEPENVEGFFNEQVFLDLFGGTPPKPDEIATLESWRVYLDWLIGKLDLGTQQDITRNTRARAAEALHAGFAQAVTDTVTHDTKLGRKAFAKLNLLLLGETLRRTKRQPNQPESGDAEAYTQALTDTQAHLAALDGVLDDLATDQRETLGEVLLRFDDLDDHLRAQTATLLARFDALDAVVREEGDTTRDAVQDDGAQTRAAVREDGKQTRDLLRDALAAIPSAPAAKAVPDVVDVFLGRQAAVDTLRTLLAEHRVVNLTGMGGIGKTEVARALGQAMQHDGEVWYTDLNTATDRTELESKVVGDWNLTAAPTTERLAAQLDTDRLYVLDDVEQALDDPKEGEGTTTATWLHTLTQHAKAARFLLTSRRVLDVGHAWELSELDTTQATDLFDTLAEEAQPGVTAKSDYPTLRDSLLPDLEGIPLALTLVAAQLDACSMADLVQDWQAERLAVAQAMGTARAPKDRSLRASLSLSHASLPTDGPVRTLFALFADLPAGATPATLRALGGRALQQAAKLLRRRALLRATGDRLAMRVPVRAFAEEEAMARPSEALADLQSQLDAYLLDLAEQANAGFVQDDGAIFRLWSDELPNLHAALDRADERGDDAYLVRLTEANRRFYTYSPPTEETRRRLNDARNAAQRRKDRQQEANTIQALGDVDVRVGEYASARARYEEARPIFAAIGARLGEANTIKALGDVDVSVGEYASARARYEEARPIFAAIGDRLGEANTIQALGDVDRMQGEYASARARYEEARPIYAAIGARLGEANTIQALGRLAQAEKQYDEAATLLNDVLVTYQAIGDRMSEAHTYWYLGLLREEERRWDDAIAALERSIEVYRAIGLERDVRLSERRLAAIQARM